MPALQGACVNGCDQHPSLERVAFTIKNITLQSQGQTSPAEGTVVVNADSALSAYLLGASVTSLLLRTAAQRKTELSRLAGRALRCTFRVSPDVCVRPELCACDALCR